MLTYIQAEKIVNSLKTYVKDLYVTGKFRRKENEIDELSFISKIPLTYMADRLTQYFDNPKLDFEVQGKRYMRIKMPCDYGDVYMDFWKPRDEYEYFFYKTYLNMDKGDQIYYKKMAINKGYVLTQHGLYKENIQVDIPFFTKFCLNTILDVPQYPYSHHFDLSQYYEVA